MTYPIRTRADVEYSIMLAVLNFQKDVMQSNYSHIQVRFIDKMIEVGLTKASLLPAEERLAQTQEGRVQLKQIHQTRFAAGQESLKKQLNEILGVTISEIGTDLNPLSGQNTITIRLSQAIGISP